MDTRKLAGMQTVLFSDGTIRRTIVHFYIGACLVGQPTAYVYRGGSMLWVTAGE